MININSQSDKLRNLPDLPGVYLFKNQNDQIIYIGKANSLAKRIKNYTYKNNDLKKSKLLEKIRSLEYIVTDSPIEALILELNLIKKYHPYFNIRLKDDKNFPYIEITQNELYPRICITRKTHKKIKSYLFGPYTNAKALKITLNLIKNIFKIRTCKFNLPKKNIKACLDYQLNLCSAPCILKIDPITYKELVKKTISFLEGRTDKIIKELNLQIDSESKKLNFEKCQIFLDMLRALKQVSLKQKIIFKQNIDADFIFLKLHGAMTSIVILQLREGKL
ncbi:MAG: GIY-YIG nuclease family protein, partial [Armatimonadetes bacterium]|nr:GIY-YIG nuclease family protein [Armatimonadota bacterium]